MQLDPNRGYDIIGDIHGCADTLTQLLELLGYQKKQGYWRHSSRMALFLGDLVDRGPKIRETLHIVKEMVDHQQAICLMGNHEYYSLGWFTPQKEDPSQFIRTHTLRHHQIIEQTLQQFESYADEWKIFLNWFHTLPLFIDAGRFRLVHACWDQDLINQFRVIHPTERITTDFLQASAHKNCLAYKVFNRLLTGLQLPLLNQRILVSKDGYIRNAFRTKFWANNPETYDDVVFQPDALPSDMAKTLLTKEQKENCSIYSVKDPLLFVGHYWCEGAPAPIQPNLACLDYSAVRQGKLTAYRLDDEQQIDPTKFVWIQAKQS